MPSIGLVDYHKRGLVIGTSRNMELGVSLNYIVCFVFKPGIIIGVKSHKYSVSDDL